jgi:hypothetical protein
MRFDRHQWPVVGLIVSAMILTYYSCVDAQQSAKVARIGFLSTAGGSGSEALRQALRHLGYIEGKNVAFEFRPRRKRRPKRLFRQRAGAAQSGRDSRWRIDFDQSG